MKNLRETNTSWLRQSMSPLQCTRSDVISSSNYLSCLHALNFSRCYSLLWEMLITREWSRLKGHIWTFNVPYDVAVTVDENSFWVLGRDVTFQLQNVLCFKAINNTLNLFTDLRGLAGYYFSWTETPRNRINILKVTSLVKHWKNYKFPIKI